MKSNSSKRQGGAVLIVSLMFLVILTMLGVTAMSGTTMEERMAGNTRDAALALQAAEAALRDARRDISAIPAQGSGRTPPVKAAVFGDGTTPGSCNGTGLCRPPAFIPQPPSILPPTPAHDMKAAPSVQYGTFTGVPLLGATDSTNSALIRQPRYIIESFCLFVFGGSISDCSESFYRITATGYGRSPNSVVTLQEVFIAL